MLKLHYSIDKNEWLEGWNIYFKTFKQKWVYIRAAIFLVPLALFVEQVVRDPSYGVGWVSIGICIACISALFFSRNTEKKNYINALEALKDDEYILTVDGATLTLETILPESDKEFLEPDEEGNLKEYPAIEPTVCDLTDKTLKCFETQNIIGLFSEKFGCVIPKAKIDENELCELKASLKNILQERYSER